MEKIVNDYKTMSKYESRNLMAIFTGVSIPNKGFSIHKNIPVHGKQLVLR
jgi:hypothetical protein